MNDAQEWRKTTQRIPPAITPVRSAGVYDMYPAYKLDDGKILRGVDSLAAAIGQQKLVVIDGYCGVLWDELQSNLAYALASIGVDADWIDINQARKLETEIDSLATPFLGGEDPLFGTRCDLDLINFFDTDSLELIRRKIASHLDAFLTIVYGTGAELAASDSAFIVYADVPKDEIQFRSRSGSVMNLGTNSPANPKSMYKRSYFVDWPVLNRHKAKILGLVHLFIDESRPDDLTVIAGEDLRSALLTLSRSYFRVRPWFEPGPWGGQWIEKTVPELPQDVPNYAWSFELIVPENGLAFESSGVRFEISFDCLMYQHADSVLGKWHQHFGVEFPIRFDWLDTFDGGNLSVQCHPRPEYARRYFGESITQDETYYILDCKPGSEVYLGFKEGTNPDEFREALETSLRESTAIDIEQYVAKWPAKKHDLFLIPNGTVHCSGTNNMVLEISATPYIFTFKMYDWMRLDLEGRPRPLNIQRAFDNLYFDREGDRISREFISSPQVIDSGEDWRIVHQPTHADHFYDVHRLEFDTSIEISTDGSVHVLAVVQGGPIRLVTDSGASDEFSYAETFVVPAASNRYRLTNKGSEKAMVVKSFIKSAPL